MPLPPSFPQNLGGSVGGERSELEIFGGELTPAPPQLGGRVQTLTQMTRTMTVACKRYRWGVVQRHGTPCQRHHSIRLTLHVPGIACAGVTTPIGLVQPTPSPTIRRSNYAALHRLAGPLGVCETEPASLLSALQGINPLHRLAGPLGVCETEPTSLLSALRGINSLYRLAGPTNEPTVRPAAAGIPHSKVLTRLRMVSERHDVP